MLDVTQTKDEGEESDELIEVRISAVSSQNIHPCHAHGPYGSDNICSYCAY